MSDIKIATYNKYYAMGQRAAMAKLAGDPPIPVPQPDPTENAEPTTVYRGGIPVPGPGGRSIPRAPEESGPSVPGPGGLRIPGPSIPRRAPSAPGATR